MKEAILHLNKLMQNPDCDYSLAVCNTAQKFKVNDLELHEQFHDWEAEKQFEMRAAFGSGTTVVNVITGKTTQL